MVDNDDWERDAEGQPKVNAVLAFGWAVNPGHSVAVRLEFVRSHDAYLAGEIDSLQLAFTPDQAELIAAALIDGANLARKTVN